MISISILTDDDIKEYSGSKILYDHRDINLKYKKYITPWKGGLYDQEIFGSLYSNRCLCGRLTTVGKKCINCNAEILDKKSQYSRFARIELPVYYCSHLRLPKMVEFMYNNFPRMEFYLDSDTFTENLTHKVLDTLEFRWDELEEILHITENISDISKCSYEGIERLIREFKPDILDEYLTLINRDVLVVPMVIRPLKVYYVDGVKKLEIDSISSIYQSIIWSSNYMKNLVSFKHDPKELAASLSVFRKYVTESLKNISGLTKGSKQNLARMLYSNRVSNSGRAPIVADPTLAIDEVRLPLHLAYEIAREDFVNYIMDTFNIDKDHATYRYKNDFEGLKDLFMEFIEARSVILKRDPVLHEFNLMAFKIKITTNYTIGLPLMVCAPFNADFDGDEMSFYLISDDLTESMAKKMSPKNLLLYKKSLKPLFVPSHETLNGLSLSTRIDVSKDALPIDNVDSLEAMYDDLVIDIDSPLEYQGRIVTYGRLKIEEILGFELDTVLGEGQRLTSNSINTLVASLNMREDRVDILKNLQEYALEVITLEGVTAPTLSEMYVDLDSDETFEEIKKIEADDSLEYRQKILKIETLYSEYMNEVTAGIDTEFKMRIKDSDRMKVSQLLNVITPQLTLDTQGNHNLTRTTLMTGMSEPDYINHSIENRLIQDVKVSSVPASGYLNRQGIFLAQEYTFVGGEDPKNTMIIIPGYRAANRVDSKGDRITPERAESYGDRLIKVRSVVGSSLKDPIMTPDMINTDLKFTDGDKIGISLMSSLTESLTQKGLSLKHGGRLVNVNYENSIKAPEDCTLIEDQEFIILQLGNKSKLYYPKPLSWVTYPKEDNKYSKGDFVGVAYQLVSPQYKLNSIIQLFKASPTSKSRPHEKDAVLTTNCYSLHEGKIKYTRLGGKLIAEIGSGTYNLNPNLMCQYPEGHEIKKFDKISAGVVDMVELARYDPSTQDAYYIFRDQFKRLMGDMTEELMELIFKLITTRVDDKYSYIGVNKSLNDKESFFASLSFRSANSVLQKAVSGNVNLMKDTFSKSILGLFLNTK